MGILYPLVIVTTVTHPMCYDHSALERGIAMARRVSLWYLSLLCVGLLGILSTWPISAAPATSYHVIDLGNPLTVGAIAEDSTVAGSVASNRLQQAALLYPHAHYAGLPPRWHEQSP